MPAHSLTDDQKTAIQREFRHLVNMPSRRLREWLDSEQSRSVGVTSGGEKITRASDIESVGHHMGERILQILGTRQDDLSDADFADMRKVVGYIHRHGAQRPAGDVSDTRWRASLMNWGHDPQ